MAVVVEATLGGSSLGLFSCCCLDDVAVCVGVVDVVVLLVEGGSSRFLLDSFC